MDETFIAGVMVGVMVGVVGMVIVGIIALSVVVWIYTQTPSRVGH